jgi:hypothetical protein
MNPRVSQAGRSFVPFLGGVAAAFPLHVDYACSCIGQSLESHCRVTTSGLPKVM